jgi:RNA polymerase sigma-70 factor (ECF subfamily)
MGAITRPRSRPKVQPSAAGSAIKTSDVLEDRLLLISAQRGDAEALAELIERHRQAVYGFLAARMMQRVDADDLCQEVFLRCFTGKARIDDSAKVRPWLLGIARNVLREHVRTISRRREVAWTELCLEVDTMVTPDDGLYDDVLGHLPQCLDGLGPSARQALELHYGERLRLADIGDKLRRSVGAVKLLMHRARQAVRRCLERKTASRDT